MLSVVSSCVTSPLILQVMRSGLVRSTPVVIQGPMLPVASQHLPWVTLKRPCRIQSRIVPSLHMVMPATQSSARSFGMRRPVLPITSAISPSYSSCSDSGGRRIGWLWPTSVFGGLKNMLGYLACSLPPACVSSASRLA